MLQRSDFYAYQHGATEFIKQHESCMLMVDCGLGKTVTALSAFTDLQHSFDARRMLVVAPLRVARKVWSDEINEWGHLQGLTVAPIIGNVSDRMAALRTPADIHTINRENVQWLEAQFIQDRKQVTRWPWDVVVLDESQSFKSQSSERWKSMRRLRRLFPRCVELSGTVAPQGYGDLWSQYYLLDQGRRLGGTETAYLERWFDRPIRDELTRWTLKSHSKAEIQAAIADITLSLRAEDYLDLPEVMYLFHRVQISGGAMLTYRKMAREFIAEVKGRTLTAVNAGVLDGKLLQLANGCVYVGAGAAREVVEFHDEKLNALEELLAEISGKVLVAYYFVHDKDRIKRVLERSGRIWAILKSDKDFDRWARGELDVGLLHPASAGHGLNDVYKSGAEDLIHYGLSANLELYQQVNDRLAGGHRRMGKNIRVHHLIADNTRDEDYVGILKSKAFEQDDLTGSLARLL